MSTDETFAAFGAAEAPQDDLLALFTNPEQAQKKSTRMAKLDTPTGWARAIEDRNPNYVVRWLADAGNHIYINGAYSILHRGQRTRYLDNDQLREIYEALLAKDDDKFYRLLNGEGVMLGPVRVGKPAIDKLGRVLDSEVDNGNHGPDKDSRAYCAWIEKNSDVFIRYGGTDEIWPNGCWTVESVFGREMLDRKGLLKMAQDAGMPANWPHQFAQKHAIRKGITGQLMRRSIAELTHNPNARETVCEQCFTPFRTMWPKRNGVDLCKMCDGGSSDVEEVDDAFGIAGPNDEEPSLEEVFGVVRARPELLRAARAAAAFMEKVVGKRLDVAQDDDVDEAFGTDRIPF